tara:strand:+ start:231 stop:998 length:768 start_codon:yes stop_codon:yes gene_type:complete
MKIVILAGGFGTRISESKNSIPKPMVEIGGKPILWHIMKIYSYYGFSDFILALGYKSEVIKNYFLNFSQINSDFEVDLKTQQIKYLKNNKEKWTIKLVDTGLETQTGGRLKKISHLIKNERFMLTYGDGLADININKLLKFHKQHGKIGTITTVHPNARFGELNLKGNIVTQFEEKPQTNQSWINGGFFIFEPEFLKLIKSSSTILEREPLEKLSKQKQLMAFKHKDFWQCMDTKRDRDLLERLWNEKKTPWKCW